MQDFFELGNDLVSYPPLYRGLLEEEVVVRVDFPDFWLSVLEYFGQVLDGLNLYGISSLLGEGQEGSVNDGEKLGLDQFVSQDLANGPQIADQENLGNFNQL